MDARQKLEELKKLIEQRQQVHYELVGKLTKALERPKPVAAAAGANAGAATKRPSVAPSGPDPKRPRVDDVDKRMSEVWNRCSNIVRNIKGKAIASVFARPVDPKKDGVPTYFDIIKNPMDLQTIINKLKDPKTGQRVYNDPREFSADMRLIWHNCRIYNGIEAKVGQYGVQLSEEFERKWAEANIEAMWDDAVLAKDPQVRLGVGRRAPVCVAGPPSRVHRPFQHFHHGAEAARAHAHAKTRAGRTVNVQQICMHQNCMCNPLLAFEHLNSHEWQSCAAAHARPGTGGAFSPSLQRLSC